MNDCRPEHFAACAETNPLFLQYQTEEAGLSGAILVDRELKTMSVGEGVLHIIGEAAIEVTQIDTANLSVVAGLSTKSIWICTRLEEADHDDISKAA